MSDSAPSSDVRLKEDYAVIEILAKWLKENTGFDITSSIPPVCTSLII